MDIITTSVDFKYEALGPIFAIGHSKAGFFDTGVKPSNAFLDVVELLKREAETKGADAVIGVSFEYRNAVEQGLFGSSQVLEIFGYGTAVKRIQNQPPLKLEKPD